MFCCLYCLFSNYLIRKIKQMRSEELSFNYNISLFFNIDMRLFFHIRLQLYLLSLLFQILHKLLCFHQLLSSLLSNPCSLLLLIDFLLLLYFLLIELFSSFLCTEHTFQIFRTFIFIKGDCCRGLFFSKLIMAIIIILPHASPIQLILYIKLNQYQPTTRIIFLIFHIFPSFIFAQLQLYSKYSDKIEQSFFELKSPSYLFSKYMKKYLSNPLLILFNLQNLFLINAKKLLIIK